MAKKPEITYSITLRIHQKTVLLKLSRARKHILNDLGPISYWDCKITKLLNQIELGISLIANWKPSLTCKRPHLDKWRPRWSSRPSPCRSACRLRSRRRLTPGPGPALESGRRSTGSGSCGEEEENKQWAIYWASPYKLSPHSPTDLLEKKNGFRLHRVHFEALNLCSKCVL